VKFSWSIDGYLMQTKTIKTATAFNVEDTINSEFDTSEIFLGLRDQFIANGKPVEVDFRKLVSWLKKGDQLTHQIHTYPAKLLPHIAHFFVRASVFLQETKIVLDPFCGSGTVALEASLAGCTPYVADANPLALMLSRVKTQPFNVDELRKTLPLIVKKAKSYKKAPTIEIVNSKLWYSDERKMDLERIARAVRAVANGSDLEFFLVCFSSTARKLSYADPAISVPVRLRKKEKFTKEVNERIGHRINWIESACAIDEFVRVCESNMGRVADTNAAQKSRQQSIFVGSDARDLRDPLSPDFKLPDGSVPLIVTSPPYGSAQKYIRASSLSLNWLEMVGPTELSSLEGRSIGREHVPINRDGSGGDCSLPVAYKQLLEKIASVNSTRSRITRKYLEEMDLVVAEMARVLATGGRAVIVVGNNQVCGQVLRNDQYLINLFGKHGVSLELSLLDDIKSRGLMTKRNRTASVISRESVLVFKK
jgi:tRNA G10  N-methylase Trm11